MSGYKRPSGTRLIRALIRHGYKMKSYYKGSHVFLIDPNNVDSFAVVPNIRKTLKIGLLEGIRKQLKLSRNKFIEILRDC